MRKVSINGKEYRILADPRLRTEEKETSLHLFGNSKEVDVYTLHPTVTRGLLMQPEFEVVELLTKTIKGEEVIIGVKGTLPIASLKIGRARRDLTLSRVFSRRVRGKITSRMWRSDTDSPTRSHTTASTPIDSQSQHQEGILDG